MDTLEAKKVDALHLEPSIEETVQGSTLLLGPAKPVNPLRKWGTSLVSQGRWVASRTPQAYWPLQTSGGEENEGESQGTQD